jgi:hypothetical protein
VHEGQHIWRQCRLATGRLTPLVLAELLRPSDCAASNTSSICRWRSGLSSTYFAESAPAKLAGSRRKMPSVGSVSGLRMPVSATVSKYPPRKGGAVMPTHFLCRKDIVARNDALTCTTPLVSNSLQSTSSGVLAGKDASTVASRAQSCRHCLRSRARRGWELVLAGHSRRFYF